MAKMFYTQAEAAAKLGKTPDEIKQMAREGRLREFMDNGPVYRIEDINKLAAEAGGAPAGDAVDLELVDDTTGGSSKEDTVITSAGISVFDDEDLQIEADPMAQTSITPSVEDQISLEGTGSGSGLLDLTREADDTSLGAELLEEIYPTAPTIESAEVTHASTTTESAMDSGPVLGAPAVIEAADPLSPAFAGMALVGLVAAALLGVVVTAIARGIWPSYLETLAQGNNPYIFGGALGGAAVVFWIIGMVIGKSTSGPRVR
ncbi:MAG: hypothetical protein PHU85_08765 [Phycisphaerae bacterium]|nr:hypothetical protein [Phycisphaerae bacterium]